MKIEDVELTQDEFTAKMNDYKTTLKQLFAESAEVKQGILDQLDMVDYEN